MNIKNFVLTTDLYLPRNTFSSELNNGSIFFEKDTFGLGYENYRPSPTTKTLNIDLAVRRMSDSATVHIIKTYNVTETGTPTGLNYNQAEIDTFNTTKAAEQAALVSMRLELAELNVQIAEREQDLALTTDPEAQEALRAELTELRADRDVLTHAIMTKEQAVWAMVPPVPQPVTILPYSEVINWFNNEGILLEEYYEDALNIPFLDGVVGDYVKA